MAKPAHLAILKQGVEAWNEWRVSNANIVQNLVEADLKEMDLSEVDLSNANL